MVYKKYIYRKGKRFGPYYCESYRDKNGKVKTRFVSGPHKKDRLVKKIRKKVGFLKSKKSFLLFGVVLGIFLLLLIGNINYNKITGKAVYNESIEDSNAEIAEQIFNKEITSNIDVQEAVDLEVKREAWWRIIFLGKRNRIMEFDSPEGKISLNFDLLDYNQFVERNYEVGVRAENFDINVQESAEEYKWGYDVELNDLNFVAKIDIKSDSEIIKISEQIFKIGNNYLSFSDLIEQGYIVSTEEPVVVEEINVSEYFKEFNLTTGSPDYVWEEPEPPPVTGSPDYGSPDYVWEEPEPPPVTGSPDYESPEPEPEPPPTTGSAAYIDYILNNVINPITRFIGGIKSITGFFINGIRGITGLEVEEEKMISIYIQKDFTNSSYKIGDIINLDPILIRIEITKAMHLDTDRITVLADIYNEVKEKDDVWSELISSNEYVRVTFEQALDNTKDITIYARSFDNSSISQIEVYKEDGEEVIALFNEITNENWYKVFLANLDEGESYHVFDLKILNNAVEFDYIVDPQANISDVVYQCGTLDSPGTYQMNQSITNNSLTTSCINITAQNVTLDCAGYYISSDDAYAGIYSNQYNTTIKGCNISMSTSAGGYGIELVGANNSYILNNTLNGQREGLFLDDITINVRIENNTANSNYNAGILIDHSHNNTIINNTANENWDGIDLAYSDNNTFINNQMIDNTGAGIDTLSANNNNFTNDTISGSQRQGLMVYGNNNRFENLVSENNTQYGIIVSSLSSGTIFVNLRACCNYATTEYDIYDQGSSTFTNSTCDNYNGGSCDHVCPVECSGRCNINISVTTTLISDRNCRTAYVFNITADDVVLDCGGHIIDATGNLFGLNIGINSNNRENITIQNCTIRGFNKAVNFQDTSDSNIINTYINTSISGGGPIGIRVSSGSNNNITDVNINGTYLYDISLGSSTTNNIFLNASYNILRESVGSSSSLTRKWYYRAHVTNTSGADVANATVRAYNTTGDLTLNLTCNESGWTNISHLIDYYNVGGTITYQSNYIMAANNASFDPTNTTLWDSHNWNVAEIQNYLNDTFTVDYDYTAPVISGGSVSGSSGAGPGATSTMIIKWNTDEGSNSSVIYEGSGGEAHDSGMVINHEIVLTGLEPNHDYTYIYISCDFAGNCVGGSGIFTTPIGGAWLPGGSLDCIPNWKCGWSECIGGTQTEINCYDDNDCEGKGYSIAPYTPKTKGCGEEEPGELPSIGLKAGAPGCSPNWECEEWSICQAVYNLEDIIKERVLLKGEKQRICSDKNNCLYDKVERQECDTLIPVYAEKVVRCFKNYIEVYDENNVLISRLELVDGIYQKLNVQMLFDELGYCPYCFDGEKNYDEDEVDCIYDEIGNCPVCGKEVPLLKRNYIIMLIILIALSLLCVLFMVWYLVLHKKSKIRKRKILKLSRMD